MKIGFAMCGSFCTFSKVFEAMETVAGIHQVTPIVSQNACTIDSRFGTAGEHWQRARSICSGSDR